MKPTLIRLAVFVFTRLFGMKMTVTDGTVLIDKWPSAKSLASRAKLPSPFNYELRVGMDELAGYEAAGYAQGKRPDLFQNTAHAEEASRRIRQTLEDYHKELGY